MARDARVIARALAVAIALAGCKNREAPAPSPPPRPDPSTAAPAAPLAGKTFYRIDAGPQTPCTAGAICEARLVLTALEGFKVNQDYPFKFVGDPLPGIALDGEGAFALDDAKSGTMTVKFRAARAGTAQLTGTFKLSVCTAEICEIETPRISFVVPVS
ncbi:MAG: hypothetical protein ACTHU0_32485 [Kofleriaceae bacterium]